MDNRIFDVNGTGASYLSEVLELAFSQNLCSHWVENQEKGLILLSYGSLDSVNALPAPMGPIQCASFVSTWLAGDFASKVSRDERCERIDMDGSMKEGWQVYVEDWGRVAGYWGTLCAVRPAWLWYGK